MRTILALLTLFSCCTLAAQPAATENREPSRCTTIPYASAAEAETAAVRHRYGAPVAGWTFADRQYVASFTVPFAWANRQVMLTVGGAPADYELFVNGRRVAYASDGNTPADFNITRYAREGRNEIAIRPTEPSPVAALESWKRGAERSEPRDVRVTSPATMGVRDVTVRTYRNDGERTGAQAEVGIVVKSHALNPRTVRLEYELLDPAGRTTETAYRELTLRMRGEDTVRFLTRIPDSLLWSPERPQRYTLRIRTQHEGRYVEYLHLPIGFRTVEFEEGRLRINGRPTALRVAQTAATATDAELRQARDTGFNTLLPAPGIVSPQLCERCDSLGLLVVAQVPIDTGDSGPSRRRGGNPSNDPAWREAFLERVDHTYHAVKRHPSVIAFSLAAPASVNGICLYEAYLLLKSYGDPRPAGYPGAGGEWNDDAPRFE